MSPKLNPPTLGPEIFGPFHVVHHLEGVSLLARKRLFVIVFAGPADPVKKDASRRRVSEEVED